MRAEEARAAEEYRRRICRALDFLNANLAANPSVAEIARAAPFSPFHFQRLFRALVGESVAEFARRVRLETAARRLRHGPGGDITGLALDLGFSSSQNFAKAFRQRFEMSPTQYRAASAAEVPAAGWTPPAPAAVPLVEVRTLPARRVVYRRHFGPYRAPGVEAAFADLERWARPRGLDDPAGYLGIPWDDAEVTADARCRFDACLIVPAETQLETAVPCQTIPAGRFAAFACEVVGHDFDLPWTQLMRDWLPGSGYQPADGPRCEAYRTDGSRDPEGRWRLELQLPVDPL